MIVVILSFVAGIACTVLGIILWGMVIANSPSMKSVCPNCGRLSMDKHPELHYNITTQTNEFGSRCNECGYFLKKG